MALVLFDLDGTLIDTADEIAEAVNRTLDDHQLDRVSIDQVRSWIGQGTGWLMRRAWEEQTTARPDAAAWSAVMASFTQHYYETAGTQSQLFPFVAETLKALKERQVLLGIVTNKETRFTERVLDAHGLTKQFDLVISGDTLPTKKPNPAGIHHALQELNQTAEETLFLGDSEIDVATAKAAGLVCWAVPYGYNHGKPIESAGPDRIIEDIRPVLHFFH